MHTSFSRSTSTPRTGRTLAIGAVAGLALAIAAPLAASAHVHADPGVVSAGSTETITFSFSHGCDGAPTTALVIDIPEGVGNATPVVQGGWSISRELGADGVPTQVTFTSDTPVEDGLKANVAIAMLFDESAAGTSIPIPVTQQCATGETAWTEVAEEGESTDDLDAPAPVIEVGDVAEGDGHGHGGAAEADDEAADTEEHADAAGDASAASAAGDPVARWLAAGGLLAGVAALVVVLVRGRSRKA